MSRWNHLYLGEDGQWRAGQYIIHDDTVLVFVRLPTGITTLGRVDTLPFVYINEFGVPMLMNAASDGVLILPVE